MAQEQAAAPCTPIRRLSLSDYYAEKAEAAVELKRVELLRAVTLPKILHNWGRILASSAGTVADFELSAPVEHIDYFVSHAWSTPRYKKVVALLMYHNWLTAMIFSVSSFQALGLLGALDMLKADIAVLNVIAMVLSFAILLFWHEITWWTGYRVFLDKACIHQTDAALKREGIQSLAAVLQRSKGLMILYTDGYMGRLWTIYELATFLLMNPEGHIELVPLDVVLMMMLYYWLSWMVLPPLLSPCAFVLLCLIVAFMLDRMADTHQQIRGRSRAFDIHCAVCSAEEDRLAVLADVEAFMKHRGRVAEHAPQQEALSEFNRVVHRTVPRLLEVGGAGLPWRLALFLALPGPIQWEGLGPSFSADHAAFALGVEEALQLLLTSPLTAAVGWKVAQACAGLRGVLWGVGLTSTALVMFLVHCALQLPLVWLVAAGKAGSLAAVLLAASGYACLITPAAFAAYSRPGRGWPWESAGRVSAGRVEPDPSSSDASETDLVASGSESEALGA